MSDCVCCLPPWDWSPAIITVNEYATTYKLRLSDLEKIEQFDFFPIKGELSGSTLSTGKVRLDGAGHIWVSGNDVTTFPPIDLDRLKEFDSTGRLTGQAIEWHPGNEFSRTGSFDFDSGGDLFLAGTFPDVDGDTLTRHTQADVKVWGAVPIDTASWVRRDGAGDIIVCGTDFSIPQVGKLCKFNASGSLQWSVEPGGEFCTNFDIDASDNIVTHGAGEIVKYSSGGTEQLRFDFKNGVGTDLTPRLRIDGSGNIIAASNGSSLWRKYDSGGTEIWEDDHGFTLGVNDIDVDGDDNIYMVGSFVVGPGPHNIRKYDSDGMQVASAGYSQFLNGVHVYGGFVYVTGDRVQVA